MSNQGICNPVIPVYPCAEVGRLLILLKICCNQETQELVQILKGHLVLEELNIGIYLINRWTVKDDPI